MTHPAEDVDLVWWLHGIGLNQSQIARITRISRGTVGEWVRFGRRPEDVVRSGQRVLEPDHVATCALRTTAPREAYAYLLGQYLGDGCISPLRKGVFVLRVACCDSYPTIMDECEAAIRTVMPRNSVFRVPSVGCTVVSSSSKHWPCLFPQHGPGKKHERPIVLEPWQAELVEAHPREFVRGLVHSDGCRIMNTVKQGRYSYPRYHFTNRSEDIKGLFCWACELLGVEWRRMNSATISVAKRASVALLDEFIGPKR